MASKSQWPIAAAIALHLLSGGIVHAADGTDWITGKVFQQRLAQPIDVLWSDTPLRAAIEGLAEARKVAVLIDRRVDPGQKLNLTISDAPMESALQTIADRCGLGVSRLGSVVYLGPPSAAERLIPTAAALQQAVRRLPASAKLKFLKSKSLGWIALSTPRDLLAQLGQENGVKIVGLDRVPHDLWAAADLPPLSLVDRLSLIAIQFDLGFKVAADGSRLELAPLPDDLPLATRPPAVVPHHDGPPTNVDRLRIQRMSVQAKPLGQVLRQLANRLELELRIDEKAVAAAGISLDQMVSVKVENATVDELLRQLLQSTGLRFTRRQKVVEILPAE